MRNSSGHLPSLILATVASLLMSCERHEARNAVFKTTGQIEDPQLDEVSGLQHSMLEPGVFFVHNDDGAARIYALDDIGSDLGSFDIEGAENRDWEDMTSVPGDNGPLLVVADTGDNFAQHASVILYFVEEPARGEDGLFSGELGLHHSVELTYPDGARDCESVAWDPASDRIILLSKRDKPARLYSIDRTKALNQERAALDLLGDIHPFRPPGPRDYARFGPRDGAWVSQPTGMDISEDGRLAAVISYRSVYLFERNDDESWLAAFRRKPLEFTGPPSLKEEAITFTAPGEQSLLITTEGIPAPIYRFRLLD